MSKPKLKTAIAAFAFTACAAAAAPALAEEEEVKIVLHFDRDAPVEEIYAGFMRDAQIHCRQLHRRTAMTSVAPKSIRACRDDLVAQAVANVAAPELTAYHARQTGASYAEAR